MVWGGKPSPRSAVKHLGDSVKIYIDRNDWWIGYYRGENSHFVCLLPTVVIRWRRYSRLFSHFLRPHHWVDQEPDKGERPFQVCIRTPCRGRTWRYAK